MSSRASLTHTTYRVDFILRLRPQTPTSYLIIPSLEGSATQLALGQHGHGGHLPGSIKATILPQKLDFTFNGAYSYALGRVEQRHPEVRVRVGQVRRDGPWLPAPESPSGRCPTGA